METKIIKTDGSEELKTPENGTDFSLRELQEAVGGYIEIVWLQNDMRMVVNEEGKLANLPINEEATRIYNSPQAMNDIIVGDVLICQSNQIT